MDGEHIGSQSLERQEFWGKHVAQWKTSGMNQAEYCREHGLKYFQLHYWKKKVEAEGAGVCSGRLRLVPLKSGSQTEPTRSSQTGNGIRLTFDGFTIEVEDHFNPSTLKNLVHVLRPS